MKRLQKLIRGDKTEKENYKWFILGHRQKSEKKNYFSNKILKIEK